MFRTRRAILAWTAGLIWASLTAGGFASLWRYEYTPGQQQKLGSAWPAGTSIPLESQRFTLVVFMHPQCPCSDATVDELTRLMTICQGKLIAHVLFIRPGGFASGWEKTTLWRDAARIPGVFVACDPNGVEAKRFGAFTSGQTALYDPAGHLLFQGGITELRGHGGDNAGADAIVNLVLHHNTAATATTRPGETAVFGCSLFDQPTPSKSRSPNQ